MCFFSKTVRHNVRNLKHVEISFGEVEVKKNSIQFQSNELFFDEVFDCRGAVDRKQEQSGFQKFYGLELEIESGPQLPQIPLLMDACIEQIDGFRFLYVLPISPQRLFIEDTRYSQNPDLDEEVYQREILSWVQKNNWTLKAISHVERGVLPIPLLRQSKSTDHRKIGLAGNRFHYITGYSLGAITEQLDGMLADEPKSKSSEIQKSIFIILNRLMFWGVDSENRIKIFKFFYKLPKDTIERFYAGKLKICDLKIFFSTKPPVSIRKAIQITIQSLFE